MADLTRVLLGEAWGALGGAADLLDLVEVTGDGARLLPSTLPALPAMVAAVATSTLAASVLTAARCGGRPGPAVIDAAHVAVAARSERYAREVGAATAELFAPLSRFWRTCDGWPRLHANYAWHRERALRVLGCEDRPEAVEDAVRSWRAEDSRTLSRQRARSDARYAARKTGSRTPRAGPWHHCRYWIAPLAQEPAGAPAPSKAPRARGSWT